MSKLYVVGPLGNWEDLTLRARDVLRRAALVVVQDTTRALPYLEREGVKALLLEPATEGALETILQALRGGDVAWLATRLTDLTGPAQALIGALLARGVDLASVPGASTSIACLVASGLPADRFTYLGLLPASGAERCALWESIAAESLTIVCECESAPLNELLAELRAALGDRRVALCENAGVWRGRASEFTPHSHPDRPNAGGRLTLVIQGAERGPTWSETKVTKEVRARLAAGASPRDTAREVARHSGWSRRRVYQIALQVGRERN